MASPKLPPIGTVVLNKYGIEEVYAGPSKTRRKLKELVPGEGIYASHPYGALLLGDDVEFVLITCKHTPTHGKWSIQVATEVMVLPSATEVDLKIPVKTGCSLTIDQLGMLSPDGKPLYIHVVKKGEAEDASQN